MPSDLKTLGVVEMVLGLLDLSLGATLIKVPTFFKKELFVVFLAGGLTLFTGCALVCGGKKPSYLCVRWNVSFNLATVMICAVAFGTLVRHTPYKQHKYCKDYYCGSLDSHSLVLINGLMAVLVTCFLMQTLVSLAVILIGLYFMLADGPQDLAAPPCGTSTTAEPLFPIGDPSYAEPIRITGPFTRDNPEPTRATGPFNQAYPEPIRTTRPFSQAYPEPTRTTGPFNQPCPEPIKTTGPFNQACPEPIRTTGPINQAYPEPIRTTGPLNQDYPEPLRFSGTFTQDYQEPISTTGP